MPSILRQISGLLGAQILTRLVSFFYVFYLARNLGVSEFGLLTVALAYFSLLSAVADFGFNRFLIREVARDFTKIPELLYNISLFRLALTSVIFAVFATILYTFDPASGRVNLILLAVLAILPQTIAQTFDAIFIAVRKLQISAIALLITNLSTAGVGFLLVKEGFGAIGAVVALILGQLVGAILLLFLLKTLKSPLLSHVKFASIKKVIIGSLPYGLLTVLGLVYFRIDAVMLSYFRGNFETGLYGAAFKFLEAVIFVPAAVSAALFPVLAKLHDGNLKEVKKLYWRSLGIMAVLGLVILAGYLVILPEVVVRFLPQYLPAISAIKVLALAIPFMFIHVPAVQVLLSTDRFLKPVIALSFLTVGFNILANLLFIPRYGLMAAAWITTLSEVLSFIVFFLLIKIQILNRHAKLS